ncbi:MAG: hypothetical protein R3E31_31150, partial [Chloroflexota bacterium]
MLVSYRPRKTKNGTSRPDQLVPFLSIWLLLVYTCSNNSVNYLAAFSHAANNAAICGNSADTFPAVIAKVSALFYTVFWLVFSCIGGYL